MKQIGGDHYERLKIQPIEVAEAWLTPEEIGGACKLNILKYLARKKDNELEDLEKALGYLQLLVDLKRRARDEDDALVRRGGDGGDVRQPGEIVVLPSPGNTGMFSLFKQNLDRLSRFFRN